MKLDFNRDGYYIIRPNHESPDQIEWFHLHEHMPLKAMYDIIGNGCDIVQMIQLAEEGFYRVRDREMILGVRFESKGKSATAWVDEEGMYQQPINLVATQLVADKGYIDTSCGIRGTMIVTCGKAEPE